MSRSKPHRLRSASQAVAATPNAPAHVASLRHEPFKFPTKAIIDAPHSLAPHRRDVLHRTRRNIQTGRHYEILSSELAKWLARGIST